jgi:carboxyl-terminal processing protease
MIRFAVPGPAIGRRLIKSAAAVFALLVLVSCGGDGGPLPGSCTVAENKQWLRDFMYGNSFTGQAPWYFWYRLGPNPDPSGFVDENSYFNALLYTGTDPLFPTRKDPNDRNKPEPWSFHQSTASFNQFFGDGQTLGYGLFVAGQEVSGQPAQPLYVRYVEPLSPAAVIGLRRGDRIISVNGRLASDMIAGDDFSALTPNSSADSITVAYSRGGVSQASVTIPAAVFALSPVNGVQVVTSPAGRKMGYLLVKDMISQAATPLSSAFANFRAAGVTELVIDLRYNGGGLVSTGRDLASYVTGASANPRIYASLLYNDQQAANNNVSFVFTAQTNSLGLARVFVLVGRRTCSASEQVINGLRGIGIDVVVIGEATCGKPVGFLPRDNGCGETYSTVNFESINALNQGRYFFGFAACPVAEDFTQAQGGSTDPLLSAAKLVADGSACAVAAAASERPQSFKASPRRAGAANDGERPMMIPR